MKIPWETDKEPDIKPSTKKERTEFLQALKGTVKMKNVIFIKNHKEESE
jgi:hypothetical protein